MTDLDLEPATGLPVANLPSPATGTRPGAAPKLCRGCREQMPTVCDGCSRKTTAYCRNCTTRADGRRPSVDRPQLGDVGQAVTAVMQSNPVPAFGGVTGWTAGRVGVHLPDHTPAEILAALRRLAVTGAAEQVGDEPERYRPTR